MIVKCLFFVLSLFAAGLASAQTVTPDVWWWVTMSGQPTWYGKTARELCDRVIALRGNMEVFHSMGPSGTDQACYSQQVSGNVVKAATINYRVCPTTAPYRDWNLNSCVQTNPNPCTDKNPFIRRFNYGTSLLQPAPKVYNGCEIVPVELMVCRKDSAGKTYCMWMVQRTGNRAEAGETAASGSDAPEVSTDPPVKSPPVSAPPAPTGGTPCPKGSVQAGTAPDGAPMCMGTGTKPNNPPPPPPKSEITKSETLPDGSIKATTTTTQTNSDGSTTTNTTITITKPDGTKETSGTSNTSNNAQGNAGQVDRPDDDKFDLCKQNPLLSICRESSVTGTCGQIACVGDAIQCATLRAAAQMQCAQDADADALSKSSESTLGKAILNGNDPQKSAIDAAVKGTEVDLSAQKLDQSGFVGGGSCFPDKSFSVLGKTVTVSFTRVCQDIQPLRAAVMACALIVAYLIVGRSVVQG